MSSMQRKMARNIVGIHDDRARTRKMEKIEKLREFIKETEKRKRMFQRPDNEATTEEQAKENTEAKP